MTPGSSDVMNVATFIVAVRIDSSDRLSNLLAVVGYLSRNVSSRVIVGSEEPDSLRAILPRGAEVVKFLGGTELPFHHNRMLNDLARLVDTPVLVKLEADILIPVDQLEEGVQLAATGNADLVLPFDFAVDIRREERARFAASGVSVDDAARRSRYSWPVLGGCVIWNRDAFMRMGMENEHFISWGLEDDERLVRVENLGGVIRRVAGPLFHIQHDRGDDSGKHTPYYSNNRLELQRIREMSPERLAKEVRKWPWTAGTTSVPFEPVLANDLTITIPVRIDTPDRLFNLVASTRALRATTTARVIVGIDDPAGVNEYMPAGVEVVAVDDPPGPYHRTRILNGLARMASTEFVANHDTDVIATIPQWAETLALLRDGADLVLPFDGMLEDYPYGHHPWMERAAYSSMPPFSHGPLNPWSVGGCVVWRRSSFFAAGMENEHFLSWGAEDDERIRRARTLGLKVERASGPLMHLRHRRGPDSSSDNPYFEHNGAELARITAMSPEELAAEVAGWAWCARPGS